MSGIQSIRNGLTGNITKVIVVAIIITFIGSVGWAGFFSQGNANVVAQVGSKKITTVDLGFEVSSQQALLNQRFPNQTFEDEFLVNFSTDSLIGKFSTLDFLERKGINLTDEFVLKQLANEEQFLENGSFSQLRFDSFARSNGFIPSDYLNRIKQDLMSNIWRLTLINSSFLTDSEVQESISLAEQERDISFIRLPRTKFENTLSYTEQELNDFYKVNLNSYIEPQRFKVEYLNLSSKDLEKDIEISESEIEDEHKEYLLDFDNTVRKQVSHIMLNINSDRNSQTAFDELNNVKTRIENGERFEDLVLEVSEDEGTKEIKGDLGITDGTLLPPEFDLPLNSMDEGDVFGPIVLEDTVHLIKLVSLIEPQPESLSERTDDIRLSLISRKAEEKYVEVLDEISEMSFSMAEIKDISEAASIPYKTSTYFSRDAIPADLNNSFIEDYLYGDSLEINYPEIIETSPLSFSLLQLKDVVEEKQIPFEQIQEKVEQDYIASEIRNVSISYMQSLLTSLNEGKSINDIAVEEGVSLETYQGLKRDSSLLPGESIDRIFALSRSSAGNVFDTSQSSNGDYLLFRLDAVKEGNSELGDEEISNISNFLNQQRNITEIGELQLALQDSINIVRMN
jgi:peptidyl-prolyl cis-trans isomerase D